MSEIYGRIEDLCKQKGVSITTMCKDCGISRATLTDYKMGRIQTLSVKVLSKMAGYFGVTVEYLYGGSQPDFEQAMKVALFGGEGEVTDEMWNEVKSYAKYIAEKGKK